MKRNWLMRTLAILISVGMILTSIHTSAYVYANVSETAAESTVEDDSAKQAEAAVEAVPEAAPAEAPAEAQPEAVAAPAEEAAAEAEEAAQPAEPAVTEAAAEETAAPEAISEEGSADPDAAAEEAGEEQKEDESSEDATAADSESEEETEAKADDAAAEESQADETKSDDAKSDDAKADEAESDDTKSEEAAKEEVKMPAQQFKGGAAGMTVTVSAPEGAFPEGTKMEVKSVTDEAVLDQIAAGVEGEVESVKAVDITFYSEGKEIEPKKAISVVMKSSAISDDSLIMHLDDNGVVEEVSADINGNKAEFTKADFSIYAVVEEGDTTDNARATVNFVSKGETVATYYVKNADTAEQLEKIVPDPGAGELGDNEIFRGWTWEDSYDGSTEAKTIEDVRTYLEGLSITEGDTVTITAMIFKAINITYLDSDEISLGTTTTLVPVDDTAGFDYTVSMAYTPKSSEENFEGWRVKEGADNISNAQYEGAAAEEPYQNETTMTIKGDVIFSAAAEKGHWLVFDENGKGATYNAPQFVKSGEVTEKPRPDDEMTRKGYTFGGWYKDKDCTEEFTFGDELDESITIYAKWTAAQKARYTILIWKQNVDGEHYDFVESVSDENGTVGETIDVSEESAKTYKGFTFKEADTDVEIVPEGSAVANVYFDRITVTLNFYTYSGGNWRVRESMSGLYGSSLADNGYTWPADLDWHENGDRWGNTSGTRTTFLDAFLPSDGAATVNFYGSAHTGRATIHFLKQNSDGNGYTEVNTVTATQNGGFYISDKYNGYTAYQYRTDNGSWNSVGQQASNGYYNNGNTVNIGTNLYIRFNCNKYSILYMDGVYVDGNGNPVPGYSSSGELDEETGINYGADVSSYGKGGADYYVPTFTDFTFQGWYVDDACTVEYEFKTMPEGITVYAKWVQNQYRVFLHPNADTDESLDWGSESVAMNFRVSCGDKVSAPYGTRDEYEFVGWYLDEGFSKVFNADAFILNDTTVTTDYDKTKDFTDDMDKWGNGATYNKDVDRNWVTKKLDIYGRWRAKLIGADGIGIKYDAGEGSNAPKDSLLYVDEAGAVAQAASTPPEDQQFLYWVLQTWNGEEYEDTSTQVYPGDTFTVLKSDAKMVVEEEDEDGNIVKASYTVQLRAEYGPAETPADTHITWYMNDGSGDIVHEDKELQINEAVDIQGEQSRTNYVFVGWAKEEEKDDAAPTEVNFLWYIDGKFYTDEAGTTEAKQVAADEVTPYEALYAIWATEVTAEIVGSKKTVAYTGEEQTNDEYEVKYYLGGNEVDELPDGVTFTLDPENPVAKGTLVGTYEVELSGTLESTEGSVVVPDDAVTLDEEYSGKIILEITDDVDDDKVVTKTSEDGKSYKLGDTVEWTIKVTNIYNEEKTLTVEEKLDGVTLSDYPETLQPGEEIEITATYVVTAEDAVAGSIKNEVTVKLGDKGFDGDDEVDTEKIDVTITADSDSKPYDGTPLTKDSWTSSELPEGFEIESVKVTGSQTLVGKSDNVPSNAKIVKTESSDDSGEVTPGGAAGEEDGAVSAAFAGGEDVTGAFNIKYENGTLEVTDDPVDDDLVVTKEVDDDKAYDVGEEVTFTVTATNIYEDPQTITLSEIEGVTLAQDTFKNVKGGATIETTATYTMTETDILAGEFENTVTAKLGNIEKQASATAKTADINAKLVIEKKTTSTPKNGKDYAKGETITYKITAKNEGNVTLKNIVVTDELTGDEWTIKSLAPGKSKSFKAEYTVTEDDIIAGSVKNEATATAEGPEDPDITPGETEDPTEPMNAKLAVEKKTTSKPKDSRGYKEGETIEYKITVKNVGNVTITDIEVKDELTGDSWTIDELKVGKTKEFTAKYKVTAKDVEKGSVTNTATAVGKDPKGKKTPAADGSASDKTFKEAGKIDTGDMNNMMPYLAAMLVAAVLIILAAVVLFRRRRDA